jgi:hypothetical protein
VIIIRAPYAQPARLGILLLAAALWLRAAQSPEELLAHLRGAARSQSREALNYTCVETINRVFFETRTKERRLPQTCFQVDYLNHQRGYRLLPSYADRFRLDVRVDEKTEMYSWIGSNRFSVHPLPDFIHAGPNGEGLLGPSLLNLFGADNAGLRFDSEKMRAGRRFYAYSFGASAAPDHRMFSFSTRGDSMRTIPYSGSLLADPDTGALIQLTVVADKLPVEASCCRFTTTLDYDRLPGAGAELWLPQTAHQEFVEPGGMVVQNTATFSGCREYRSGIPPTPGDAGAGDPQIPMPLPAGLPVTIDLTGTIDTATAAAGDPFSGRLAKPIVDRSHKVLAPRGAAVHGRIRRLIWRLQPPYTEVIQLEVDTIEIGGAEVPIRLTRKDDSRLRPTRTVSVRALGEPNGELPTAEPGHEASRRSLLLHKNGKHWVLHDGFRTEWETGALP